MKIAVDISPIDSGSSSQHRVRGVGKYITLLKNNLEKYDTKNTYIFTSNPQAVKADIIHYPYFDPFFITLPFNKKVKTVVTIHDVIPLVHTKHFPVGLRGMLKWSLNRMLLKNIDIIITDSIASREDIIKVTGIAANKIVSVPLSVDYEFKKKELSTNDKLSLRKKYGLPEKFALYVGDVTWNKNLPSLINACIRSDIPLVLVGKALTESNFDKSNKWNNDRQIITQLVEKNSLFTRLGYVPINDLVDLYNIATILCMPSIDEGFGLPVLEAMSCGCPVVSSKQGSLYEVGGDAAFYVEGLEPEQISIALKEVFENTKLQEDLSRKGIVRSRNFTIEKMISNTVKAYLLNEKKN